MACWPEGHLEHQLINLQFIEASLEHNSCIFHIMNKSSFFDTFIQAQRLSFSPPNQPKLNYISQPFGFEHRCRPSTLCCWMGEQSCMSQQEEAINSLWMCCTQYVCCRLHPLYWDGGDSYWSWSCLRRQAAETVLRLSEEVLQWATIQPWNLRLQPCQDSYFKRQVLGEKL